MPSESPCFRAVTAFRSLATAAFFEGYYSQSIPRYGTERRGAPALEVLGKLITNTAILGAFCKATGTVKLESIIEAVK